MYVCCRAALMTPHPPPRRAVLSWLTCGAVDPRHPAACSSHHVSLRPRAVLHGAAVALAASTAVAWRGHNGDRGLAAAAREHTHARPVHAPPHPTLPPSGPSNQLIYSQPGGHWTGRLLCDCYQQGFPLLSGWLDWSADRPRFGGNVCIPRSGRCSQLVVGVEARESGKFYHRAGGTGADSASPPAAVGTDHHKTLAGGTSTALQPARLPASLPGRPPPGLTRDTHLPPPLLSSSPATAVLFGCQAQPTHAPSRAQREPTYPALSSPAPGPPIPHEIPRRPATPLNLRASGRQCAHTAPDPPHAYTSRPLAARPSPRSLPAQQPSPAGESGPATAAATAASTVAHPRRVPARPSLSA